MNYATSTSRSFWGIFAVMVGLLLVTAGCASTQTTGSQHIITVEGQVSTRGNVPFTAQMLETDQRNLYILNVEDAPVTSFTYGRMYRITGRLYKDDWNSYPYAHLQVLEVEEVTSP